MPNLVDHWIDAMRAERFEDAWTLSERALAQHDPATRDDPSQPYHLRWVWDRRPFDGRHVLVRCYHGLGDTIQFARFLPALAPRVASLTVEVQPRLLPLLRSLCRTARLVPFDPDRPLPPSECDMEITELAFALRERPDTVPPPYLHAPASTLPEGTIGICHEAGHWDDSRSIPPELFRGICEAKNCLTLVAQPSPLPVLNPEGCPFDLEVTAWLVSSCALVITVDTMVAHLAGALGRPAWLLLKAEPDWRWTPGAKDSPWYPQMRIYFQPRSGDWEGVMREVERDLTLFGSADVPEAADA